MDLAVNIPAALPLLGHINIGVVGQKLVNGFDVTLLGHGFSLLLRPAANAGWGAYIKAGLKRCHRGQMVIRQVEPQRGTCYSFSHEQR
jgi:hypothetical protein